MCQHFCRVEREFQMGLCVSVSVWLFRFPISIGGCVCPCCCRPMVKSRYSTFHRYDQCHQFHCPWSVGPLTTSCQGESSGSAQFSHVRIPSWKKTKNEMLLLAYLLIYSIIYSLITYGLTDGLTGLHTPIMISRRKLQRKAERMFIGCVFELQAQTAHRLSQPDPHLWKAVRKKNCFA